ncbi:MAG: APC family permease [Thioploca sp.]|nr:APC family permease [Thioploca sp.]
MSITTSPRPQTLTLIATGSGTAMASVCAVGLLQIEQTLGGIGAVAAISVAGLLCLVLARALARLTTVLPSGAGLIAFLSRAFGRAIGIMIVVPYLFLMLLLVGFEALIVGELVARLLPIPVIVTAVGFLVLTWAVCRAGIQIGYLAQALTTLALLAGLTGISVVTLLAAYQQGDLLTRLYPTVPTLTDFVAGIGQALFLFMGFELLTSHVELADQQAVNSALSGSVGVLMLFYAIAALGLACLPALPQTHSGFVLPQLLLAEQTGRLEVILLIIVTGLLASFSSFNGALLALSRFIYALASQGLLPRPLAKLESRTLTARPALQLLLGLTVSFTLIIYLLAWYQAVILAAAVAAAGVYAAVLWAREWFPFRENERAYFQQVMSMVLALSLVGLGIGVIVTAAGVWQSILLLLVVAYGTAALLLMKPARPTSVRTGVI